MYCQLNAKAGESYKLAKTLQNGLRQLSPGNAEPAITNKNVYVLRENPLSSVLIELGNLNNEPERDLLMNTAKQKIIAKSLVASLLSYRQH